MQKFFAFIFKEFIYNGHLQAIGAATLILISYLIFFGGIQSIIFILAMYFLFQSFFLFDRYTGIDKDSDTNSARSNHIRIYLRFIPYIIFIYMIIALFLVAIDSNSIFSLIVSIIILVSGFLYPLYFKNLTKTIPLFKNMYVSSVYAIMPLFLLFHHTYSDFNYKILSVLIVVIFVESLISQLYLDTKDLISDKKIGLKTLPSILGNQSTLKVALITSFANFVILIISFLWLNHNMFLYLAILNFLLNTLVFYEIKQNKISGYIISAAKFSLWLIPAFLFIINL